MINHIVFLTFKAHITESEINSVLEQLGHLMTVIPAMKDFSFGKNCSPEKLSQGYTHAFIMKFDDAHGRDVYLNHPEHKRIAAELIFPMLENGFESVVVVDYAA
ncbi:Dabb family protein [Legionella oakridgensis]|uniref:Stress responsive A/B barrel domain protein n=2 Tax=Legionella oakridgensis TaxID=29423 RepID=W0BEQ8_9GAMM|nr:Dabb family protein [Legionella oakridgensis]AHE67117.1 stress responsive A/B barrel domain protein [Legionella oakridgensis ATCC 33761 = DSM 21215]KTD38071.1 Stress responsive A/B barrel domain protein [Legionella oakridgensis]STY20206.1 Stress responsive A/B barrel domain protein [Legionella longbeachae]